jgi:hypothetical protein
VADEAEQYGVGDLVLLEGGMTWNQVSSIQSLFHSPDQQQDLDAVKSGQERSSDPGILC